MWSDEHEKKIGHHTTMNGAPVSPSMYLEDGGAGFLPTMMAPPSRLRSAWTMWREKLEAKCIKISMLAGAPVRSSCGFVEMGYVPAQADFSKMAEISTV